jgi:4-hydroxy-2-oxoheptanedioate aldolase
MRDSFDNLNQQLCDKADNIQLADTTRLRSSQLPLKNSQPHEVGAQPSCQMRISRIKSKVARDEPALCVQLHLTDPAVFELTSLLGFDGIWMDLEHHGYSVETAGRLMQAARVGSADIVARPGKGEFMRIGRLLEIGAQAIMYPRCESAAEAAEVVRWSKFPPLGTRGFDGSGPDSLFMSASGADYLRQANEQTLVVIQLEDQLAIDQAEQIAGTPGVDMIMLGPADFSILSGIPFQFDHPKVKRAMEKISAASEKAGKPWACTTSFENAREVLAAGCRVVFCNADIVMIKNALDEMKRQFAPLGFTFSSRLDRDSTSYIRSTP